MASINKLSIRGVRSFSPDDAEQVVEFYFPCTIIVGANGCGKTTIIESLKFAVSGSMPPGNKSGQAFVHDPRSLGQSSVKANIKLRFTGRAGNSMVVVRSMEVQQKKTTMTFKQLDGVLRSTDRSGNRVSMGHKCSELDRQLPLLLGVSGAILEHVVFCHQEDSSWPLQEGAVLKKRFDDIFDSTRYSKALEVFSKLRKDYSAQVKDLKAEVAGVSSHRHAAKGFREQLAKYNGQMDEVDDEMKTCKDNLKALEEEQGRLDLVMNQMDEINAELESRKNEYATQKQVIKKQFSMLRQDLTKELSLNELNDMLRDFEGQRVGQLEQRKDLETKISALQNNLVVLKGQDGELTSRIARLEAGKEAHEQALRARSEKLMEMIETYSMGDVLSAGSRRLMSKSQRASMSMSLHDEGTTGDVQHPPIDISQEDMESFYQDAATKEEELKEALRHQRENNQKCEDQYHEQLADVSGRIKSIQTSREQLNKKQGDARNELKQISESLLSMPIVRQSDIEEARQQAARFAKERDQANTDPRKDKIPVEIRDIESKLDSLKRDLEDERMTLEYLRQTSDIQQTVSVLKGQCLRDLEELEESMQDFAFVAQSFNISSLPKKLPTLQDMGGDGSVIRDIFSQLLDQVNEKLDSQKAASDRANHHATKLQQEVSECRVLLNQDQREVEKRRTRLALLESSGGPIERVSQVVEELKVYERDSGGPSANKTVDQWDPQGLVAYLSDRLVQAERQSGQNISTESLRNIFSQLMKQARTDTNVFACPCCTRTFDNEIEFEAFRKQLKILASKQSPLLQTDERSKESKSKYTAWKDIVTEHYQEILEYSRISTEIKNLDVNIQSLDDRLSESLRKLEEAKVEASDLESQVASLRDLQNSVKSWSEAAGRIAEKCMQISQKEEQLTMSTGIDPQGRSLHTVELAINDLIEKRESYAAKMNRLNKEMSAIMSRINTVTSQATRTEQLVQEKEKKYAEEQRLVMRKRELTDVIANCAAEEKKLQEQLAPLAQKQKSIEMEKSRMRALNNEEDERISSILNSFLLAMKEIRVIDSNIKKYLSSTSDDELASARLQSVECNKKIDDKRKQINSLKPELDNLLKAIEDQESHKKNLKDNIDVINANNAINGLNKHILQLEEKAKSICGHDTLFQDIASLRSKRESIIKSTARLEGRRGEILESIRTIKRKLSSPEYKDVDEEYRVAMIKYETTQMAVKDLDKYHAALDKALLKFHGAKIEEINKIIRDLWNLTYKGEDITSIEIVSGQESGARTSRSYNYRVVMTKGSTKLDMRGRCSAGQRVLASIVIRLALAETFCVNFGCIALDEPTVNLDFSNKRGLAIALAQIIASRSQQRNFQLVLITHDEDFVAMMKAEFSSQPGFPMPEKYFQVRREEGSDGKFYSKIDAIDWEELI